MTRKLCCSTLLTKADIFTHSWPTGSWRFITQPTQHSGGMFLVTVILPTIAPEAFEQQTWITIANGSMALPSCPNLKITGLKICLLDPSVKMMLKLKNPKWSGDTSASETRTYFPNPEKFSSWTRFRHVLTWICRFVENCKRKAEYHILSSLTATEIHKAEMITVRKSQRLVHFDIEALRANKQLPVRSRLSAPDPYVDEAVTYVKPLFLKSFNTL